MRFWQEKFEALAVAAAFAEAGEWQTATEIFQRAKRQSKQRVSTRKEQKRSRRSRETYRA